MTNPTETTSGKDSDADAVTKRPSTFLGKIKNALSLSASWLSPPNASVKEVQRLAAAIARCEVILEHYDRRDEAERNTAGAEHAPERSRRTFRTKAKLLDIMRADPRLSGFIKSAYGDPELALALAKAKVKELETLRQIGWAPPSGILKPLLKILVIPGILIALTALLGNWVGTSLQESSFRRNRKFDHKIAILQKQLDKAAEWYVEAGKAYYDIYADEDDRRQESGRLQRMFVEKKYPEEEKLKALNSFNEEIDRSMVMQISRLQKLLDDLDGMSANNRVIDRVTTNKQTIAGAEAAAKDELLTFVGCLQEKKLSKDWNKLCYETSALNKLKSYRDSFGDVNISILEP